MPNQAYFPTAEAERLAWLNNYLAKLPTLGLVCGITSTEITATQADIIGYVWVVHTWYPAFQQEAMSATVLKSQLGTGSGTVRPTLPTLPSFANPPAIPLPGVLSRLFNQIARIKMHSAYTEAIGRDLGIIGTPDTTDHTIPDLTAASEQGNGSQRVRLSYTKYGHDGVHIESRRNGGDWEFLAINNVKPHLDTRPLLVANTPETREYRIRYWDKGEANGEYSAVQRVTVGM